MNLHRILLRLIPSMTLLAATSTIHAGPLPPCITATLSANAQILVLNELTLDTPDPKTFGRKILASTFRVLRRTRERNDSMQFNGPDAYWADPLWSVELNDRTKSPILACPYTLVTNDGEFLILLGSSVPQIALRIYRRRDHPGQPFGGPGPDHGILIREIALGELWPSNRMPTMIKDEAQWFGFGTFTLSPDNRTLVYKTQWATSLKINLMDGAIVTH